MIRISGKAKHVTNWWLQKLPSYIFCLTINTTEKWMNFHAYNDTTFIIGGDDDEQHEQHEEKILEIKEFLPNMKNGMWIRTIQQDKDQISVYWIPYDYSWLKQRSEILIDEMENYIEQQRDI